jgi:hypothetical protein
VLLYWFRTPPYVKVGRAALDEETIRVLEDTHPQVDFDWPRILASRPQPSEAPPEENRPPRRRRGEGPRPLAARRESPIPEPTRTIEPDVAVITGEEEMTGRGEDIPAVEPERVEVDEPPAPARKFVRVFDASPAESASAVEPSAHPEVPKSGRLSEPSASERALGSEQLERLRGRYAAAMARIARRVSDPVLADRLRSVAERANPDAWVTDDEVKEGLARLNEVYADLTPFIGRRRRRRGSGRAGSHPDATVNLAQSDLHDQPPPGEEDLPSDDDVPEASDSED